jgi:hypothetical protein
LYRNTDAPRSVVETLVALAAPALQSVLTSGLSLADKT